MNVPGVNRSPYLDVVAVVGDELEGGVPSREVGEFHAILLRDLRSGENPEKVGLDEERELMEAVFLAVHHHCDVRQLPRLPELGKVHHFRFGAAPGGGRGDDDGWGQGGSGPGEGRRRRRHQHVTGSHAQRRVSHLWFNPEINVNVALYTIMYSNRYISLCIVIDIEPTSLTI